MGKRLLFHVLNLRSVHVTYLCHTNCRFYEIAMHVKFWGGGWGGPMSHVDYKKR